MRRRVFLSYEAPDEKTAEAVATRVQATGAGISGRWAGGAAAKMTDLRQQVEASSLTVIVIGPGTASSDWLEQEVAWSIGADKGLLGVKVDPDAPTPPALHDAGAEVLDWTNVEDVAYLEQAMTLAIRSARLMQRAANRGSGTGAPCARPGFSGE